MRRSPIFRHTSVIFLVISNDIIWTYMNYLHLYHYIPRYPHISPLCLLLFIINPILVVLAPWLPPSAGLFSLAQISASQRPAILASFEEGAELCSTGVSTGNAGIFVCCSFTPKAKNRKGLIVNFPQHVQYKMWLFFLVFYLFVFDVFWLPNRNISQWIQWNLFGLVHYLTASRRPVLFEMMDDSRQQRIRKKLTMSFQEMACTAYIN